MRAHPDPRGRRRRRAAAPRREARPHPQHRAREPRAAVGAPRHRAARTHAMAVALRDGCPSRRGSAEHRGISTSPPRAPHALKGRRGQLAVLPLGRRAAAATPDRRPPRRPVFLSSLRPSPGAGDICPLTGHARLSYRCAAELLVSQTGCTLHQFRHCALTHLAENDVQLLLLMAKSRHRSLRALRSPWPRRRRRADGPHDRGRRR
jgi:hypothetical protein